MLEFIRQKHEESATVPARIPAPQQYESLIDFLAGHISFPEQAQNVFASVERFRRLTSAEQHQQIPSLYLAMEQHLVEIDSNKKFLREQLREIVKTRFPALLVCNERLDLIFHSAEGQEILLCREFLRRLLFESIQIVQTSKRPSLAHMHQWLQAVPGHIRPPLPLGLRGDVPSDRQSWLALFRKISIELYRYVSECLTEEEASRLFDRRYEELVDTYVMLETFPVIMYLLPEGLMDRGKMALLRLGNTRRALSDRSEQLHEITEQLLGKNNELAAIRSELNKAKAELEVRVQERTVALESINRQLREEVAERRNTEAALRASQEYIRNIINSSLDMIVAVDRDRKITEFNKAAQETFGYTREEVVGQHVDILYAEPGSRNHLNSLLAEKKEGCVMEIFNCRKNGQIFPSILSASTLRDANGTVIGHMGVSRDITREKEAEATLRESEERYKALFEESKDVVFICTPGGQLTDINAAGVEVFGFATKEDLLQADTRGTIFTSENDCTAFFSTLLNQRYVKDYELNLRRKDRKEVTVTVTANAVMSAGGEVELIRGIMRDVTERKRLEQQLLQSQKLESIGLLAGGIAHDINNVLTPVLMSLDMFKTELQSKESLELVEMVEAAAKRGADIVKQILMIARRVDSERIELDVRHLMKEMVKVVTETFPKTIRVRTEVPKTLWRVQGDSSQLHQILLNLTVNARDAMQEGGTLTLSLENVHLDEQYAKMKIDASAGPYVVLTVRDTGSGIPHEHLAKVFEPFFTTKDPGKGTGLGLSTVHSIVKGHRGFVEVDSEPGQGTAFKVYLPAVETPADGFQAETRQEPPRGKGERILVVDDESSIRGTTTRTLEKHGYRAVAACDGTQAVALFTQQKPAFDLVVTDLSMPVMDGYATIRALERIDPSVCIIASSGRSTSDATLPPPGARVFAVLQKPYTAEKLLFTVRDVLSSQRRSASGKRTVRSKRKKTKAHL